MRRALVLVPCLLLLASLAIPAASSGQQTRVGVAGTWSYAGPAAQGESIVRQAVDPVVSMMRYDLQPVARERIAESTWLPTRIRITAGGRRVQVALTGSERRMFRTMGAPIQVPMRQPGQYAQLTQYVRPDGALQQDFVAVDGTQQNVYYPGPNGTMMLDVTLQSPILPSAIHFQLQYRRGR